MHNILESTFAHIFLYLEITLQRQVTHIYITLNQSAQFAYIVFAIFSLFNDSFLLIGHSKQCWQSRRILMIEK